MGPKCPPGATNYPVGNGNSGQVQIQSRSHHHHLKHLQSGAASRREVRLARSVVNICQTVSWLDIFVWSTGAVHAVSGHCTVATTGSRQESAFCVVADTRRDKNKPRRKLVHVRFSTAETQFKGDTLTRQKYKKYWRQAKVDLDFDFDLAWTCDWDWDKKKVEALKWFYWPTGGGKATSAGDCYLWDKWRERDVCCRVLHFISPTYFKILYL